MRFREEPMARQQGGHNALSIAQHRQRRTLRPARHLIPTRPEPIAVTDEEQRRVLSGLRSEARKVASRLLAEFGDWTAADLETLRSYAASVGRMRELEKAHPVDPAAIHREARHHLRLWKALELSGAVRRRIGLASSAPPNPFLRNAAPRDQDDGS